MFASVEFGAGVGVSVVECGEVRVGGVAIAWGDDFGGLGMCTATG